MGHSLQQVSKWIDEAAKSNGYGDPYEDDIALLKACLSVREDYDILGDSGYRYAREMFDEMTLADLPAEE